MLHITEHSEICNKSPPSFADANAISPYRAGRGKGRLWSESLVTASQIWNARLIYRSRSNAAIYKFGCTVTGGAYHSARKVRLCVLAAAINQVFA